MLLELINSYKLKINDLKNKALKGERALELSQALKDFNKFKTLDINELLELLKDTHYETYPLNKVGTTLDYIRRNNLFDNKEYKSLLTSVISSLETLKLEKFNQEEIDSLLNRVINLENSIESKEMFITDFPLINKIIKECNLAPIEIYNIMLEIDNLNKITLGLDNLDKHTLVTKLLDKYGYKTNLTEYEESLIETVNISALEEKLEFLKGINEYDFLHNPFEHHRLTMLLIAPIKNIKDICEITMNSNLNLKNIFSIFYFNSDYKLPEVNVPKDYFYESYFEGSYETFINNSRLLLKMGCNLKEAYENSSELFYMSTSKLESNKKILDIYNIPISIPNVLSSSENDEVNLDTQIDKFIEVGLYDYIKRYPQTLLNKDKALFHRIYYARKNGLPIKRKYLLRTITSINGYSINEENYQDKVETYESPLSIPYQEIESSDIDISNIINVLDTNYLKEDNVYQIENTYISRNKVIRLLKKSNSKIEGLLYSILNGVLLDKETFDKIVKNVLDKALDNNLASLDEVNDILSNLNLDRLSKGNRI